MPEQIKDWRVWVHGLAGAAISSAANSISCMIVDPVNFNFAEGKYKLLSIAGISALVGAMLYLKQSPLPPAE